MTLVFSPKSHSLGNANSLSRSCKVNVQLFDLFKVFAIKTVGTTTGVSRSREHVGLNSPRYSKYHFFPCRYQPMSEHRVFREGLEGFQEMLAFQPTRKLCEAWGTNEPGPIVQACPFIRVACKSHFLSMP